EAQITSLLFSRLFLEGLDELRSRNIAEYQHSLTLGSTQAITTLLGSSISLISELFLQITLAIGLFLYSPSLFLITTLYFSILAISMSKYLGKKAQAISRRQANSQTDSTSIIYNMIAGFREIRSSGKSKFFVKQFRDSKLLGAKLTTEHIMLGQHFPTCFSSTMQSHCFEITLEIPKIPISLIIDTSMCGWTKCQIFFCLPIRAIVIALK
ncbi:MAG: ABC transporter ATP-binding protein, partial [Bacteroidetes bacterium]|nr:ABC transporter ATP-binding protein [Bacteroidota bacterium]